MNQEQIILKHLERYGSITQYEAFHDLGVTRLSAVIYMLKKRGHKFKTKSEHYRNRYGKQVYTKRYFLNREV